MQWENILKSQGQFQLIHFINKGNIEKLALRILMPKERPCLVRNARSDLLVMFSSFIFMLEQWVFFYVIMRETARLFSNSLSHKKIGWISNMCIFTRGTAAYHVYGNPFCKRTEKLKACFPRPWYDGPWMASIAVIEDCFRFSAFSWAFKQWCWQCCEHKSSLLYLQHRKR